jgi:hypothetical protein
MEAPPSALRLNALPVTPLEQVLGSCLEALGAEHLEAEGVGEPVGRVERCADASASWTCWREALADSTCPRPARPGRVTAQGD